MKKKTTKPGRAHTAADRGVQSNPLPKQVGREIRQRVLPRLKSLGIATVTIEYSGYGNTRAINYVEYFDAAKGPVDVAADWPACSPMIERFVHEILPEGFETGLGGQGDVMIDIRSGTVTIDHEDNSLEVQESTEQFSLR